MSWQLGSQFSPGGLSIAGSSPTGGYYFNFIASIVVFGVASFGIGERLSALIRGVTTQFTMTVVQNTTVSTTTWSVYKLPTTFADALTIPAGNTGTFIAIGSQTWVSGDRLYGYTKGGTSGYTYVRYMYLMIESTFFSMASGSWYGPSFSGVGTKQDSILSSDTTYFGKPPYRFTNAATVSTMFTRIASNSIPAVTMLNAQKNDVNTALLINIPASTTGFFYDYSDSVAFAANEALTKAVIITSATGLIQVASYGVLADMMPTQMALGRGGQEEYRLSYAATTYIFWAYKNSSTSDGAVYWPIEVSMTLRNFVLFISSTTLLGATFTMRSRKNGVDGNLVVVIPASGTGYYSDMNPAHVDSYILGDMINIKGVGSGGGGSGRANLSSYFADMTILSVGQPYILRVQGIPGMRSFSQLGHGGM